MAMMRLCSHLTLRDLSSAKVFVPLSLKPSMAWILPLSLFRNAKLPQKLVSLLRRPPKVRFLWQTCLKQEVLGVQVSALCV